MGVFVWVLVKFLCVSALSVQVCVRFVCVNVYVCVCVCQFLTDAELPILNP